MAGANISESDLFDKFYDDLSVLAEFDSGLSLSGRPQGLKLGRAPSIDNYLSRMSDNEPKLGIKKYDRAGKSVFLVRVTKHVKYLKKSSGELEDLYIEFKSQVKNPSERLRVIGNEIEIRLRVLSVFLPDVGENLNTTVTLLAQVRKQLDVDSLAFRQLDSLILTNFVLGLKSMINISEITSPVSDSSGQCSAGVARS